MRTKRTGSGGSSMSAAERGVGRPLYRLDAGVWWWASETMALLAIAPERRSAAACYYDLFRRMRCVWPMRFDLLGPTRVGIDKRWGNYQLAV